MCLTCCRDLEVVEHVLSLPSGWPQPRRRVSLQASGVTQYLTSCHSTEGAGVALTPSSRARSVDRLRVLINFVFCPRCPLAGVMASWGVAGTHVRGLQTQEKLVSAVFSERQDRELLFQAPNQVLVVGKNSPQKMLRKNGKV